MIVTPLMWGIKQRITFLAWVIKCHPKDRAARSEIKKLIVKYKRLGRREQIGLKLVDSRHPSSSSTGSAA
jgi:hypothetical protein